MSVFRKRALSCPRCGRTERRTVAVSLNAPRVPQVRDAILDGSFQRFTCESCGGAFVVDGPLVWLDLPHKRWLMLFPAEWERAWRTLERDTVESHKDAMIEHAPDAIRAQADGYTLRTCFGFAQLRDKLRGLEAGLDDAALEVLKLEVMRSSAGVGLAPASRLELLDVRQDALALGNRVGRMTCPGDDRCQPPG